MEYYYPADAYQIPSPTPNGYIGTPSLSAIVNDQNEPQGYRSMVSSFLERIPSTLPDPESELAPGKAGMHKDRIDLLLDIVTQHDRIRYDNLKSLYHDLFSLDRLKAERPFPDNYRQDAVWMKITDNKLRINEAIRREQKDHAKLLSQVTRDMVDALVDYKRQVGKEALFGDESYFAPREQ